MVLVSSDHARVSNPAVGLVGRMKFGFMPCGPLGRLLYPPVVAGGGIKRCSIVGRLLLIAPATRLHLRKENHVLDLAVRLD